MDDATVQTIHGAFRRLSDGAYFKYIAKIHFDVDAFSAKVFDANGELAGTLLSFLTGADESSEFKCRNWVERCIREKDGVK